VLCLISCGTQILMNQVNSLKICHMRSAASLKELWNKFKAAYAVVRANHNQSGTNENDISNFCYNNALKFDAKYIMAGHEAAAGECLLHWVFG
jgi:hypothetical protein